MATQQLRPRPPRLRPYGRRGALLDAAKRLFSERGPDFTTADLAGAAGGSEGTSFRYFPDKAALLSAVKDAALDLEALHGELMHERSGITRRIRKLTQPLFAELHGMLIS